MIATLAPTQRARTKTESGAAALAAIAEEPKQLWKFTGTCHNCEKPGHKAADCKSKKPKVTTKKADADGKSVKQPETCKICADGSKHWHGDCTNPKKAAYYEKIKAQREARTAASSGSTKLTAAEQKQAIAAFTKAKAKRVHLSGAAEGVSDIEEDDDEDSN